MTLERLTAAEVIRQRDPGVVDQEVKLVDLLDGSPDLRRVSDVEHQRRDPVAGMCLRLPGSGIHPLGASPQYLFDERSPETAVGSGDKN